MKKISNIILVVAFFLFIVGMLGLFLTLDKKVVSYNENRALARIPELSVDAVQSGEWMTGVNALVTDHFPFRDFWLEAYIRWQMASDQTFVYEYLIEDSGWVFAKPINYFPKENMDVSIEQMERLGDYTKENDIDLFYVSLPDRKNMLPINYPEHIKSLWEKNKAYLLDGIRAGGVSVIDVGAEWLSEHNPDELFTYYWRTDHHWNMAGAFYGYQVMRDQLANRFSIGSPLNEDDYDKRCYPEVKFVGGYNKQLYELVNDPDVVCYIENNKLNETDFQYYIGNEITGQPVEKEAIYGKGIAANEKKVDYAEAYANDLREITIVNEALQADNTRTLVIKDSFSNIFLPLVAEMSHITTFYDIRYNGDRPLKTYLEENKFDRILILYNDSNIFKAMYDFGY